MRAEKQAHMLRGSPATLDRNSIALAKPVHSALLLLVTALFEPATSKIVS